MVAAEVGRMLGLIPKAELGRIFGFTKPAAVPGRVSSRGGPLSSGYGAVEVGLGGRCDALLPRCTFTCEGSGMATGLSARSEIVGIGCAGVLKRSGLLPLCDPYCDLIRAIATFSWSFLDNVCDLDNPSSRPEASLFPCAAAFSYHFLASLKLVVTNIPIS